MPNPIKYTTGSETLALKKGNFYIGTGDVGKGPSDTTGFYQGVSPSAGGYVIYMNKSGAPGDLSYHNAANDSELISFTNSIAGTSYTTSNECLVYFAGQTDKMCVNRDYESIVTDELVLNLDAGFTPSYPRSGTTWYDVSGSNNGTLTNGPTFNSDNGGTIVFDSTNDMTIIPYNTNLNLCNITNWTISVWINLLDTSGEFNCIIAQWPQVAATDAWLLHHSSGTVGFTWAPFSVNINLFSSNTRLIVGDWTNVVLVKNNSDFTLYQNTNVVGTATNSGTKNSPYQIELGRYGKNGNYIGAKYSTVRINHKSLTQVEVLQNYNAQKSRFGL